MYTLRSFKRDSQIGADLCLVCAGRHICPPSHYFGPAVRDYYLIHYILNGKGTFKNNTCSFSLNAGQGFLIRPNELTFYKADDTDPWEYVWIGFSGSNCQSILNSCGLSEKKAVFTFSEPKDAHNSLSQSIIKICDLDPTSFKFNYSALGHLYQFFAELADKTTAQIKIKKGKEIINKALEFIEQNYFNGFSVQDLAKNLFIDRTYLFKLFKEFFNISPSHYLTNFRLEKSCSHLLNSNLKISVIAKISGFSDTIHFWRAFKQRYATSPLAYRKNNSNTNYN